ncbi:DNA-binding protein [Corynebacterium sp. HMSC06C06]|uniref:septation protein SepH n=1 Tax=Corynebacterium TaxID=1716 RepID=UPI0008A454D6|nr:MULTISPECIES: septation protein SepH [Corynebacterium]MDK8813633.1 septation protein SepH [Corynebacterium striatum]OFT53354.1 DNA-binding protein [Corynebacterium sp. HMSC06C06]HAT1548574.1 DUF3071 domain-containing protein [Corynebacterium striatum]
MRELFLAKSDSTTTSLVMQTEEGEEFFLAVTDDLREILHAPQPEEDSWGSISSLPSSSSVAAESHPDDTADTAETESADSADADSTAGSAAGSSDSQPAVDMGRPSLSAASSHTSGGSSRDHNESRPHAISLRPAEIQTRIRAGASAAEIAEEIGAPESRIEPFAHPVLLERARIAEIAKQAHPVREDGPAKLTLWEILATAFAARGHSLSEATWDAYRHQGEPWVVRITWKAGLSENEAEWTFKQTMSSPATVEARNSVAADLTDPDFVQPVRSLTSVGRGERYDKAIDGDAPIGVTNITNITDFTAPTVVPTASAPDLDSAADADEDAASEITRDDIPAVPDSNKDAGTTAGSDADAADEDFLQNPSAEPKPKSRRRRAVTPRWEDVLLGVRSNTKRPRE